MVVEDCGDWRDIAEKAVRLRDESLLDKLRVCYVVKSPLSHQLLRAREWVIELKSIMSAVMEATGARGFIISKELRSFMQDPLHHLAKKLFIYSHDLLRGKYTLDEFDRAALAAIRTSLRTNLRSIYESWVFLAIVKALSVDNEVDIVYPEHKFILLGRSGQQRSGQIPPNLIVHLKGQGFLSFYLEAPRPISWEDTRDLSKAWRLYVALRPDIMVYGGLVSDIVELSSEPPIRRPEVIIEVKELTDWYERVREIKGPLSRGLTAEEWRDRWIQGLWLGLADVIGAKDSIENQAQPPRKRGLRLREPQIVRLYMEVYRPRRLYLVSRAPTPGDVRAELNSYGVEVIDDVGFNVDKLKRLTNAVRNIASYRGASSIPINVSPETFKLLYAIASEWNTSVEKVLEALVKLASRSIKSGEETQPNSLEKNHCSNRKGNSQL